MRKRTPAHTAPPAATDGKQSHEAGNGAADQPHEAADPLEHLQRVKQSLREALTEVNATMQSLKRHRRRTRAVESTLASLRQLQEAGR